MFGVGQWVGAFSHGFSFEVELVGGVHEAVEDGIDEIGYLSYSNRHADLLFESVNRRYEAKPTIVTTNRPFTEWGEVFPNAACVVSIVDRLIHHSKTAHLQTR